jgi:ornithine carbamoyltransferase
VRHFITGAELTPGELSQLLDRAAQLKEAPASSRALAGKSVAMIFEKPSTRTRVSFEVGIVELGGHPVVLRSDEMQISRGESIRDVALVLSRHVAGIGMRTGSDDTLAELSHWAQVPVFNMLSPSHHPVQVLADLQTMRETFGDIRGRVLAYVGDGNNMARSLAIVGALAGVEVRIASPPEFTLEESASATLFTDPFEAVRGADVVYTDVWVSMSDDAATAAARRAALGPYAVTDELMAAAGPGAVPFHCLPAHPGEEVSESVLYGERQRAWDQAENRRHAQKALLELLLG